MICDTEGYAIPFAGDDQIIESGVDDADYGPAESWPEWTDSERFEPSPDDEAWRMSQNDDDDWQADASEQARWSRRLEELYQASEWHDRLEAIYHTNQDQDIEANGLPVG
jgi:hypothetical protein